MTFFGYPRGHRVKSETLVFEQHGGLTSPVDTLPRTKRLKNPIGPPLRMIPRMERTLCQRRSSCLFQIVGVETCSFLPDNQGDRGNLPRQGETSHRWSHPFGEQGPIKGNVLCSLWRIESSGIRTHMLSRLSGSLVSQHLYL